MTSLMMSPIHVRRRQCYRCATASLTLAMPSMTQLIDDVTRGGAQTLATNVCDDVTYTGAMSSPTLVSNDVIKTGAMTSLTTSPTQVLDDVTGRLA